MNYDQGEARPADATAPQDGLDRREFSLMEHLSELRVRLMRAAAGVLLVSLGTFAVAGELLVLLKRPVESAARALEVVPRFVVISPAEYFIAELKAAVVLGVFLSMPWTLYQLWLFVAPGLYAKERRYVLTFVWAGAFFFVGGGAFAYFAVFPGMFEFFLRSTLEAGVEMTLSVAEHFSFSLKMLLAFGLVFQAPVIVYVLSMAGVVDPYRLSKHRGIVVVSSFVIGAVLTPPDVLSQTLLALPLIVLFEAGLMAAKLSLRLRRRRGQTGNET